MKKIIFGVSCFVLAALFVGGWFIFKEKQERKYDFLAKESASTYIREYSQTLGSVDAKVILIEFFDPACETCAAFSPYIKKLVEYYPGKLKLVLRYAPFHEGADYFVKILEAARIQNKYWETLDAMYKSQSIWASHHNPQPDKIWSILSKIDLDLDRVRMAMNSSSIAKIIQQDLADAKTLNVTKTPGFFVNGKPLQQFGFKQLLSLIESEMKANYPNQ